MGKPIEDIVGRSQKNTNDEETQDFFRRQKPAQPSSDIHVFEEKQRNEIRAIDSEIDNNPFLARYAHRSNTASPASNGTPSEEAPARMPASVPPPPRRRPRGPKVSSFGRRPRIRRVWVIAFLALVCALGAVSFAFAKAIVLVTPKNATVDALDTFSFSYQAGNALAFEKMVLDDDETASVTSSGSTTGDVAATGKVKLYNSYSTTKQNLLINTRLEAPDGKIYMTDVATSIPGFTKDAKGQVVPGSVEVGIHAEKAGESYNKEPTDFVIFGFKSNKDKSEKMYARSTTPIAGGSTGLVYTISDEEYQNTVDSLTQKAEEKLKNRIRAEVPDGYVVFDDGFFFEKTKTSLEKSSTDITIPVSLSMKATALILPMTDIATALQRAHKDAVPEDLTFTLASPDTLSFTLQNKEGITPSTATSISVRVEGKAVLYSPYDRDTLLATLIGKKTKEIPAVLASFPSIDTLTVKMRPPWRGTFPDKVSGIALEDKDLIGE